MSDAFNTFYRIKRGEVIFHSLVRGSERGQIFRRVKKMRDQKVIEVHLLMTAVINCIAYFADKGGFDIITTPPDSGEGESFAGFVAKAIGVKAGIDYVKVFKDHGQGKRKCLAAKFQPIAFDLIRPVTGERVLVFDDFALTGGTMAGSIRALREFKNDVEGVVICA